MARQTVLYFEDDEGYGRVARDQDGYYDREERTYHRTTDRLLIEGTPGLLDYLCKWATGTWPWQEKT